MFKWIALGSIGVILLGLHLTSAYLTQVIAGKNHDNATYLVAEYKARPGNAAARIRYATARCVTERVDQNIPALNKLFGDLVLYIVTNVDKDDSTVYRGLMGVLSRQEATMFTLTREADPSRAKAIQTMFAEFQEKPLNLISCVANKMQNPVAA